MVMVLYRFMTCLIFIQLAYLIPGFAFGTFGNKIFQISSSMLALSDSSEEGTKTTTVSIDDSTSTDKTAINKEKELRDLIAPLMDFDLLKRTLEQWSRPLPPSHLASPLILVGPSGVGKGRLTRALLKDYGKFFKKVVTYTTRNPRPKERDGVHYYYVSNATFQDMVQGGKFLEWAKVHDNFYGTAVSTWREAQQEGKISIMEIDIQGARTIRSISQQYGMTPKYLFIKPPNIETLRERLARRGTESEEQVNLRVANANTELEEAGKDGQFDAILVNADIEQTSLAFFRLLRDWYSALPSIGRLRMLQRRAKVIKELSISGRLKDLRPVEQLAAVDERCRIEGGAETDTDSE